MLCLPDRGLICAMSRSGGVDVCCAEICKDLSVLCLAETREGCVPCLAKTRE